MAKKTNPGVEPQANIEETALEGWEILKKYQQPLIITLMLSFAVVMFLARDDAAKSAAVSSSWQAFYEAEKKLANEDSSKEVDLDALAKSHQGDSVEPFVLIRRAEQLYQEGSRDSLAKAQGILERFVASFPKLGILHAPARAKIAAIKAELAHAPSWAPIKEEKKDTEKGSEETSKDEG